VGSAETTAGEGEHVAATIASAIALHQRGQLAEAEAIYLALLQADEHDADALHFLGVLRHQQGQSLTGVELIKRALASRPEYCDARNNLGNIHQQLGASADAAREYLAVLALRPDHPDALRNLGITLRKLKRYEEAIEVHLRAVEQQPADVQNYYGLANAYREMGLVDEALATMRKALAMRPEHEGFRRLGQLLYGLRRTDEAAANYRAWLEVEPDSPVARHMLAACTGQDVPERAGDAFVAAVFDGFAESFDEVLMQRLEYRAPALLGDALRRVAGEPRGVLDIADAGCGTGLLAQHLRPYARHLVGVDLSPKMLLKAQRRGAYDRLIVVELGLFLRSEREAFDVVASSDTLVYFGDLREVLAAAARALRAGGLLLFTLEDETGEAAAPQGYRIHPHGRYSHTDPYVRASLAEAGFDRVELAKAHLRREGETYVDGLVVAARAAGSEKS
jgi:predicted TPR repeat methyltransferase